MTKKVLKSIFIFTLLLLPTTDFIEAYTTKIAENQNRTSGKRCQSDELEALFDITFRIDIESINVEFDYSPEDHQVTGRATVRFKMRSGQQTPLIHFNPGVRDINSIKMVKLNNQQLNIETDIKTLSFDNTTQKALEFQKELSPNQIHTLYMEYELALNQDKQIFTTAVDDVMGIGNEELFPTINSPQELATHEIRFRNMSSLPLKLIGSGHLTEITDSPTQEWILKPVRPISSYTFMFVLIPESEVDYREMVINGVKVKMMTYKTNEGFLDTTTQILEECLPDLEQNIGPFPMPEGLNLFITNSGGMEYYGGSITRNRFLAHEVFHMYFGCSVVNKTYRDTWLDEAINKWYEYIYINEPQNDIPLMDEGYTCDMVSGRSPVALGFDSWGYIMGPRMIETMASRMGSTKKQYHKKMLNFLKYLCEHYQFKPFTSIDFVNYFKDYSGIDMVEEFKQWVCEGKEPCNRENSPQN